MKRMWKPYLLSIFVAGFTLAIAVGIAYASELTSAPNVPSAGLHCEQSALNSKIFIELIDAIIAHGDMTDVPFLEKTLHVKLNNYQADSLYDAPIHIDLNVESDPDQQVKKKEIAFMRINGRRFPDPDREYITACLQISPSEFSAHFGGSFLEIPATDAAPVMGGSKELDAAGKNNSKFSLRYSYNINENVIDTVALQQHP